MDEDMPDSEATGKNSVAIGGNARAVADNSVAIGNNSVADQANTVSFGTAGGTDNLRLVHVADGIANDDAATVGQLKQTGLIGPDGKTRTAVTYDVKADGTADYSSISLNNGTAGTVVHNVADGVQATDAVNVRQLDQVSDVINNLSLQSSPMFAADGDRALEAATASGTHAVASGANAKATGANAVATGANSIASGNGATAIGAGSQATADNSVALGQNSVADRANTVSVGTAGGERQVTNVAEGTQGTDAVNVNQLNDAKSQANSYTDLRVNKLQGAITDVQRKAYSGVAAATALSMIPDVDKDKVIAVGVGGAGYQGYGASALGVNLRITQNVKMKAGAGLSGAGNVYGAGAAYQW
ncbi:hypothetical protein BG57_23980 [Caballeronia grimmiae]|nr:hypothetical protein BG57_23980 [Caballeronia grimmiae]